MRLTRPAVIAASSLLFLTGCASTAETASDSPDAEASTTAAVSASTGPEPTQKPVLSEAEATAQCLDEWHPGVGSDFQANYEQSFGTDHYLATTAAGEWRITLLPKLNREAEWNLYCATGGSETVALSNGYDDWPAADDDSDHVLTRSQALEQCRMATRDSRMALYAEAFEELYPNELAVIDFLDGEWAVTLVPSDISRAPNELQCTSDGAVFTFTEPVS